ncbi:MAG: MOSC domain-containing protein [bacterium]
MKPVTLSEIVIYPVKSMRGIQLLFTDIDNLGPKNDRRWMLIDDNGEMLTARKHPRIATVQPALSPQGILTLLLPDGDNRDAPLPRDNMPTVQAKVWQDIVKAVHLDASLDQWLSDYLEVSCRLVWFPETQQRQVDLDYAKPGDLTGFSDGFPLLLISEASLADLNRHLETPVPMKRFRPNLVVSGCGAFDEDNWKNIRIGDINFDVVKPCSRCIMTTVDPATGTRMNGEPLRTLMTYRKQGSKVMFGQNLIHQSSGELQVGMEIFIEEYKV